MSPSESINASLPSRLPSSDPYAHPAPSPALSSTHLPARCALNLPPLGPLAISLSLAHVFAPKHLRTPFPNQKPGGVFLDLFLS